MAHYRKLDVDGKNYQFNIGDRFVLIKSDSGTENVLKSEIGFTCNKHEIVVTPKMIRDHITDTKGDVTKYFRTCGCKGVEKKLGYVPFDAEIYNKINYVVWCQDCYNANADDI